MLSRVGDRGDYKSEVCFSGAYPLALERVTISMAKQGSAEAGGAQCGRDAACAVGNEWGF